MLGVGAVAGPALLKGALKPDVKPKLYQYGPSRLFVPSGYAGEIYWSGIPDEPLQTYSMIVGPAQKRRIIELMSKKK